MVVHKKLAKDAIKRKGKEEEGLVAQAKLNAAASSPDKFDNRAEKGAKAKVLSIANPMNTVSRATGGRKADVAAPLYFPGAKSTALRSHSGVKFVVYRVDSPEDVSDPITIIFKLDLSAKTLRVSNPAALSQKMSRKYYELKNVDIDLWDFQGKFGISLVERKTTCFCMVDGIERDYVFQDEASRERFCCLIHAQDDGVLPSSGVPDVAGMTPKSAGNPLRLFVSTWNQGDTETSKNLAGDWIPTDGSVDIFCIGTQESPLGKVNQAGLGSTAANKWFQQLQETVGDEYVAVATRSMFQNHLWVATKREHAEKFSGVETYQAEQGIGKVWGNKGGTAVALRFNGYKLCFVNTHLAAHAEKWEKRNEDIQAIVQEVQFGNYAQVEFSTQYTTFWLGDMNYRVEMDRVEATEAIESGNMDALLSKEQLKREMERGLLDGFVEGELSFRPTYKFDPVEPVMPVVREPRKYSAHKDRTPSWTDRVLMRPLPGHAITQTNYDSAWKVTSSDHDPVFAEYDVVMPEVPTRGNYRRFVIELGKLTVKDLRSAGANMELTINFPFLDDIKKGVKFKHSIAMVPVPGQDGSFHNASRFKLGPFITTAEYFRRCHVILRLKDKDDRHGTTAISLQEAVAADAPQMFSSRLSHRTWYRGEMTGEVLVRVAGGQEDVEQLDEDSVDYEQMKAAGEVDEEVNSDEEDRQISIDEGAGSMEPEPEPEPEATMGDGAAELLASVTDGGSPED